MSDIWCTTKPAIWKCWHVRP